MPIWLFFFILPKFPKIFFHPDARPTSSSSRVLATSSSACRLKRDQKQMGTVTGWLGIFGGWEEVNQTYSESKWWWTMVIYHGRICKQSPTKQIQISSWESKGIYSQCHPPTRGMRPCLGNDHDDNPPCIRQLRYLSKFFSFLKPEFWGHFEG